MSAPQKTSFEQLSKTIFASKGIVLPGDWESMGALFQDAFRLEELSAPPNPGNNLFREATLNQFHVRAAREMGLSYEAYIEGVCGSVCNAITYWMGQASIAGMLINGPVGTILPGCVIGPDITHMIYSGSPRENEQERRYSNAIAGAIGSGWKAWHMGLTGMLQYPSFAAYPAAVAPPEPNVPVPVAALTSAGESALSPGVLKDKMSASLGSGDAMHADALFDCISKAFNSVFTTFKMSTLIMNVLGTGNVPLYATAMIGPVVAGTSIPAPGVFV